jgi:hypothetical protein
MEDIFGQTGVGVKVPKNLSFKNYQFSGTVAYNGGSSDRSGVD